MVKLLVYLFVLFSTLNLYAMQNPLAPSVVLYSDAKKRVQQLVTPSFDSLPLDRKLYAYYLSMAAQASNDIAWIQDSRDGLAIRQLLEGMWSYSQDFDPAEKEALGSYYLRLLKNHKNYDVRENAHFKPEGLTQEQFLHLAQLATERANRASREYPIDYTTTAQQLMNAIYGIDYPLFYKALEGDKLLNSGSNYYGPGVSQADLATLAKDVVMDFLGYIFKTESGELKLEKQRINDRFSSQLKVADAYMALASQYANDTEKEILAAYRKALRSGKTSDLRAAEALWVQYKPKDIDFILNFIESYADPLDIHGTWEGIVIIVTQDEKTAKRVATVRANAAEFEKRMPVKEEYKKTPGSSEPPNAEGAYLLYTTGEAGEAPFAGVNLPNDPFLRETYGSKSFTAINVMGQTNGSLKELPEPKVSFLSPKYKALEKKFKDVDTTITQVEFHEIYGHGSGRYLAGFGDSDLQDLYSPLEEARAEVASLYHMTDPLIRDLDIVPKEWSDAEFRSFAEYAVVEFFQAHLSSYFTLAEATQEIRQAHMRARQVMLNYMLEKGAIRVTVGKAKIPYVSVTDLDLARTILGGLWAIIQDAKSTGSYEKAEALFEQYDTYGDLHKKWRKLVVAGKEKNESPKDIVFANPSFKLVKDSSGNPQNVVLKYLQPANDITPYLDDKTRIHLCNNFGEKPLL